MWVSYDRRFLDQVLYPRFYLLCFQLVGYKVSHTDYMDQVGSAE